MYNNIKCKVIKKQLQHLENEETTYNFEVEDNHNYYVGENSVLVHNHCGNTNGDDAGRLWLKYKKYKVWIDTGEYLIDLIRGI